VHQDITWGVGRSKSPPIRSFSLTQFSMRSQIVRLRELHVGNSLWKRNRRSGFHGALSRSHRLNPLTPRSAMSVIIMTVRSVRRAKAASAKPRVPHCRPSRLLNVKRPATRVRQRTGAAIRVVTVRGRVRRHLRATTDHRRMSKWAGQQLWPDVRVGSRFGMYPSLEINLHLDYVCPAQPSSDAALGYAFRRLNRATNLLPFVARTCQRLRLRTFTIVCAGQHDDRPQCPAARCRR
jgi:hypothetical protein